MNIYIPEQTSLYYINREIYHRILVGLHQNVTALTVRGFDASSGSIQEPVAALQDGVRHSFNQFGPQMLQRLKNLLKSNGTGVSAERWKCSDLFSFKPICRVG